MVLRADWVDENTPGKTAPDWTYDAAAANAVAAQVNSNTAAIGHIAAEQFGAVGDGVTDDTAALQDWLDAVTGTPGVYGILKSGSTYLISDELVISTGGSYPVYAGYWTVDGQGATIIQDTDNTPVIHFTNDGMQGWAITNLLFDYTTQQTSAAGSSAILFSGGGISNDTGWFNAKLERLGFLGRCYRGIANDETEGADVNSVWNTVFHQIWGYYGMTGSLIRLRADVGATNNRFSMIYQNRIDSPEPVLDLHGHQNVQITNFEANWSGLGGPDIYVQYSNTVSMDTVRVESPGDVALPAGDGIFEFKNCQGITVTNWQVEERIFEATSYVFKVTDASLISIGTGNIRCYSATPPGAELHVVYLDADCRCSGYENVARPAAVVDFDGDGTVTGGTFSFVDYIGFGVDTCASVQPSLAATAAAEVPVANTTTETDLITTPITPSVGAGHNLQPGSTWRFTVRGTVQTKATSGTLTFKVYIGPTAAPQTFVMASQGGAEGPVAVNLTVDATIRSIGATGTYLASGFGRIELATPVILSTTTTTTTTFDTTAYTAWDARLTAKWETADVANSLKVETAIIERIA